MVETVAFDEREEALILLDQTQLPNRTVLLRLRKQAEIREAIRRLQVRGAPAIGVTAAYGMYLAAQEFKGEDIAAFLEHFQKAKAYLAQARPTAVNLFWALERMERAMKDVSGELVENIKRRLKEEADNIREEDIRVCRKIGEYGLSLLKPEDGILTHCNAGRLAAVRYGTATAPLYVGQEQGYHFQIYADETRPLLQGARLTAYELSEAGMDVTVLCDNMAASIMSEGKIQAVLVGCDRVAMNGDTANKIGTSMVAMAAHHYGIPFYVCAPTSTIDPALTGGKQIPIEQRDGTEVTHQWYKEPMAPEGVPAYNPAFDVTDHRLITAIITEYGVLRPPYKEAFQKILSL